MDSLLAGSEHEDEAEQEILTAGAHRYPIARRIRMSMGGSKEREMTINFGVQDTMDDV